MKCRHPWYLVAILALPAGPLQAEWQPVAGGIDYRQFELDGPMRVFVARADRTTTGWTVDTTIGGGTLRVGLETVSQLAERYDDSVNFAGERYGVKVAINGDYFYSRNAQSVSGQIISGWYVKRYLDYSGGTGFVWTSDRRCFLGGNVRNGPEWQSIRFADGSEHAIQELNAPREPDQLVLYTPHFAATTHTDDEGVEVVIQLEQPLGVAASSRPDRGRIVEIRKGRGSTPLLFDHVVLSGHGQAARLLERHAARAAEVSIKLGVKDYGVEEIGVPAADWNHAQASLGGHFYCVVEGKVPAERWERKGKPGAINRHPRTAVAFNDRYIYYIVVDGRSKRSVGMSVTELGRFCADHLEAVYAIAQDGGGSSAMWLEGRIVNVPSDGRERPVANGYILALVHPPSRSTSQTAGRRVTLHENTPSRLGPGSHYAAAGTLEAGQAVRILPHRLNGIRAKGTHSWFADSGEHVGWIPEARSARPEEADPGAGGR